MTRLLKKAMSEVEKLTGSEQDAVADLVLEELSSEQRWTELFAKSRNKLVKLADMALADHIEGRTKPL